jgi:hypothetical protein
VPRSGLDIDQVVRLDHRRDVTIDELAAMIVHDPRFEVFSRFERRLQLDRHRFTVEAHQKLVVHDIPAVGIDKAEQKIEPGRDPKWSERPDVVELSSGLSAPNRTCTFPRIRLSISSVAHSKDKIGVM